MDKMVLNTIASFLETGIGIWIFGKVFPKRETYGRAQSVVMYVWCISTLLFFYLNFIKRKWRTTYILCCLMFLLGHFILQRLGKKQNTLLFFCLTAMVFLLLARNSWYGYLTNGIDLFGGLFPPLLFFSVYQCSFLQAYLWGFFYYSSLGLLKLMYFVYASETQGLVWYNHTRLYTYESIGYKFLILGFVLLLIRFFPLKELLRRLLSKCKRWIFFVSGMIWVFTYHMTGLGEDWFDIREMTIMLGVTICLIVAFLLLLSKSFIQEEKAEKMMIEMRNAAIEKQYEEIHRAYEQKRRFVHDQKHMVQYLEECLSRGEIQKAETFLSQYKERAEKTAPKTWTGISTLDFILNIKSRAMEQAGIEFKFEAALDEILIEESDFVVLMGNLFDNAIEAAEKCRADHRNISLSLKTVNRMLLIRMENSSQELPNEKQGRFITVKNDTENHGCGIESIKYITEKYGGEISFVYNQSIFRVSIVLNSGFN